MNRSHPPPALRPVTAADAEAIVGIYNWYIANTVITFEEDELSPEEMAQRITSTTREHPWLVVEEAGEVTGYAYATAWKSRSAYRFSRETSVYLHPERYGRGLGTSLMQALIGEMRQAGARVLIAGIALPNPGSIALHEKLGFRQIGHFEQVGFKFGAPVDVGYWQLTL